MVKTLQHSDFMAFAAYFPSIVISCLIGSTTQVTRTQKAWIFHPKSICYDREKQIE
jgi:hypothetical protein